MGNEQSNQKKKGKAPTITKQGLEMMLLKIKNHCEVLKSRKINDISSKEQALRKMIESPNRSKSDEVNKASLLVQDTKYFRSLEMTIRNAMTLKEHSMYIVENIGYPERMSAYTPIIEGLLFAEGPLNIKPLKEFESVITYHMGPSIYLNIQNSPNVDPELKTCCSITVPTQIEIEKYLVSFCEKNSIDIVRLTMVGHNVNFNDQPFGGGGGGGGGIPQNYGMPQQYGAPQQGQNYGIPPQNIGQPMNQNYGFPPQNSNNMAPPQNFAPNYSNYIPPNIPVGQQPNYDFQQIQMPQSQNFAINSQPFPPQNPQQNQSNPQFIAPPSNNGSNISNPQNFAKPPQNQPPQNQPPPNYNNAGAGYPGLDSTFIPKNAPVNSQPIPYNNNSGNSGGYYPGGGSVGNMPQNQGGSNDIVKNLEDRLNNL